MKRKHTVRTVDSRQLSVLTLRTRKAFARIASLPTNEPSCLHLIKRVQEDPSLLNS